MFHLDFKRFGIDLTAASPIRDDLQQVASITCIDASTSESAYGLLGVFPLSMTANPMVD